MTMRRFIAPEIDDETLAALRGFTGKARADALMMVAGAGSGHIGGSLSSLDLFTVIWLCADVGDASCGQGQKDSIVVSHGHTAAGVYSVLGNLGYFDVNEAIACFRRDGSRFDGHPGSDVPGVEWTSGSLGQGLSVGCGFALAARMRGSESHVFVVMGDGEQGKGQIQEAREFAVKYGLGNLTAVVDCNGLQASGSLSEVMPQHIAEKYRASGWDVVSVDGHDFNRMYIALRDCYLKKEKPTVMLAGTVMGKGMPEIENDHRYHGGLPDRDCLEQAAAKLRGAGRYFGFFKERGLLHEERGLLHEKKEAAEMHRANRPIRADHPIQTDCPTQPENLVDTGTPISYPAGSMVDCRTAFGEALADMAAANRNGKVRMAAVDCDLAESVKLVRFKRECPDGFIECGIQEHNAATVAAALSKAGILTFFADFGVFGIDETYGQLRMADLNHTSLKLVCTHCGLDVGEDGKTHQCIDYISLMRNLYGFEILVPADANQTDRAVRYAAGTHGNKVVAVGRSRLPVIETDKGDALYGEGYTFRYGKADWVRRGRRAAIVTCGGMVHRAVNAWGKLKSMGIDAGVLNFSCPSAPDEASLEEAASTGLVVTYEDHNVATGIGSILGAWFCEKGISCRFHRMGITAYGASASPDFLYRLQKLGEDDLVECIAGLLGF